MPWRSVASPYRTWISEIMLQQTTVAAVAPRFESFVAEFPDPAALAAAPEQSVLAAWAGLGYYSRARNLRLAAQKIVAEHGGRFPETLDQALALPGIGRYTAGAVLSIAYGKAVPLVDGNVMRVFARLFEIEDDVKTPAAAKRFWALAAALVDPERPGDWNQALMELGATVCVPESPRCPDCPAAALCAAHAAGRQDELPRMPARKAFVDVRWSLLWIEQDGQVLLWKRSASERLLKGHWALPESRHLPKAEPGRRLGETRGTVTHHKLSLEVFAARAPKTLPPEARWTPLARLKELVVSSLLLRAAYSSMREKSQLPSANSAAVESPRTRPSKARP